MARILIAAFMVALGFSIVNVALSSIQRELHVSAASVQRVVTACAIAFGGLLILGGRAGDLYGRRRLFLAGIGVFTAASLAGGLARGPVLLIAARVVQGTGAAMVAPAALSLITTGFAEGPRRTRALGLYGATASIGFVAGQVLGGVLVEFLSWRSVFLVNVPVGLAALLLAPHVLRESRLARVGRKLDAVGAVLITLAVAALVFAVSQIATTGIGSVPVLARSHSPSWRARPSRRTNTGTPIRSCVRRCCTATACATPALSCCCSACGTAVKCSCSPDTSSKFCTCRRSMPG
ncbi:MFS transporter [Streptomyces sp. NPDC001093]|uniref:MFS transporter n=1 Tax=Streptomyces sp. NPDC001093 TaxID=3154376 RepID=UPI0033257292